MTAQQARLHDTPIPHELTAAQHAEAAGVLDRAFLCWISRSDVVERGERVAGRAGSAGAVAPA